MAFYGSSVYGGGSSESTPPVITNVVNPSTLLGFWECDIYDTVLLRTVAIFVTSERSIERFVAYDYAGFHGRFLRDSTVTGLGTLASPYHIRLRPASGWPPGATTISAVVVDAAGNVPT